MFTNKTASYYSQGKVLIEAACLSTDTKPTTGVANGSKCIEMDTGKKYMFNEEDSEWEELPSSGGGGGGGTTVEALSVTQNGTYTAPSGKAYSPVAVNVSGGSSDFSTATLSIVDEGGFSVNLKLATLNERRGFSLGGFPGWNATDDIPVILYKGTAKLGLENLDSANISISGAIEDVGGNAYIITGDGTITIS